MIMNLGIVAIIWFGGVRINIGSLTQGELTAFTNYMTQILLALVVLANLIVTFTKAFASANRVREVFELAPEESGNEIPDGKYENFTKTKRGCFYGAVREAENQLLQILFHVFTALPREKFWLQERMLITMIWIPCAA